jgi:hypothetical protein
MTMPLTIYEGIKIFMTGKREGEPPLQDYRRHFEFRLNGVGFRLNGRGIRLNGPIFRLNGRSFRLNH